MKDKDFLTIYEFCECLGIHYNTARNMIKCGRLSAIKMGVGGKTSDYRIPTSEIQRLAIVDLEKTINEIVENRIKDKQEKYKKLFFEKIEKTIFCWIWKGAKSSRGYGVCSYLDGNCMRANRVSYLIHKGQIPEGMLVCHSCDNPECVNPEHLFLGTPKDNMDDMKSKGREKRQSKGENANMAKLKDSEVIEIRELRKQKVPAKLIAIRYNISANYVYQICAGIYRKEK